MIEPAQIRAARALIGWKQTDLTALERGMHALHSGMTERAYAESIGRPAASIHKEKAAAEVAAACFHVEADLSEHFRSLSEIHASPRWLWSALVAKMVEEGMTVEATPEDRGGSRRGGRLVIGRRSFALPSVDNLEPRRRLRLAKFQ